MKNLQTEILLSGDSILAAEVAAPSVEAPAPTSNVISGTIVETMDAAGYTYVRVDTGAQKVWNGRLTLGASLKAIYSSIDDYTSDAYAVDMGVIAPGPVAGMTLGASLANLGTVRSGYTSGFEDQLPVLIRLGLSHRPAHAPLPMLLLADLTVPNDNDAYFTFGAEISTCMSLRPSRRPATRTLLGSTS